LISTYILPLDNMVNSKAQEAVQKSLDSVTSDKSTGVAGLVFVAVDKNGDEIVASASGKKGLNSKEDMSLDSIFWIASCTKILATIACLQAVEQGKLSLDDHKQVYKLCPELEKVKVLQDDGSLVDKEKEITLRMLLSHTAGFGYEL
jgi:CubicO group peptidase (beta-lactamase class C family)